MLTPKSAALILFSLLLAGCTTTTITNLTPKELPRNKNGIYLFEVALETKQQTLRTETLRPAVMIGLDSYPMERALMLTNRWEALVPIGADKKFINYRFKFEYDYNRFGPRGVNSKLSPQYQLEVFETK